MAKHQPSQHEEFPELIELLDQVKKRHVVDPDPEFKRQLKTELIGKAQGREDQKASRSTSNFWTPFRTILVGVGTLALALLVVSVATEQFSSSHKLSETPSTTIDSTTSPTTPQSVMPAIGGGPAEVSPQAETEQASPNVNKGLQPDITALEISPPSDHEETGMEENPNVLTPQVSDTTSTGLVKKEIGLKKIPTEFKAIPVEEMQEIEQNVLNPVIEYYSSFGSKIKDLEVVSISGGIKITVTYMAATDVLEDLDRTAQFPWMKDESGHYPIWSEPR